MAAESPKVTVIIPAFNAREHIGEALDSVREQNFSALEAIVVDDGSQDGTAEYVESGWPWVQVIRKTNGGAATARNAGLRAARGEYVAFMDADDIWLAEKLQTQIAFLEQHPDAAIVCTGFRVWQADEQGAYPAPEGLVSTTDLADDALDPECSGWVYHKLLLDSFVWTSTVVMRSSLAAQIGEFDETLRLGQDYDYWLRAARLTPIHTLRRPFALYRQHPRSATARGARVNYGAQVLTTALQRWGVASPDGTSVPRRQVLRRIARIHFANGFQQYHRGDPARARSEFASAIRMRPLRGRSWAYLLLATIKSLRTRPPVSAGPKSRRL